MTSEELWVDAAFALMCTPGRSVSDAAQCADALVAEFETRFRTADDCLSPPTGEIISVTIGDMTAVYDWNADTKTWVIRGDVPTGFASELQGM